eukprot:1290390-Amphidinium_carterae.1
MLNPTPDQPTTPHPPHPIVLGWVHPSQCVDWNFSWTINIVSSALFSTDTAMMVLANTSPRKLAFRRHSRIWASDCLSWPRKMCRTLAGDCLELLNLPLEIPESLDNLLKTTHVAAFVWMPSIVVKMLSATNPENSQIYERR